MQEEWKPIAEYNGLYFVSDLGRIKSMYKGKEKLLKQHTGTTGYKKVSLYYNKHKKDFKVHRLVALHFVPNKNNFPVINHKDGNKLNNSADNLEWCSHSYNVKHAYNIGLKKSIHITKDDLIKLYVDERKPTTEIAEIYNTTKNTVCKKLQKYKITARNASERKNKYNLPLDELLNDLREGKRNIELSKKYNCSTALIAIRKHQFKERGILDA